MVAIVGIAVALGMATESVFTLVLLCCVLDGLIVLFGTKRLLAMLESRPPKPTRRDSLRFGFRSSVLGLAVVAMIRGVHALAAIVRNALF